jgi:hypothetical protein
MINSTLDIIGYCDKRADEIIELIETGKKNTLLCLRGEYTLVYNKEELSVIITSVVGAMQYYYYYDGDRFCHGKSVIEIVKKLGIKWEWDWESIGDCCELENCTNNRTLHRKVQKVPPGSILTFEKKLYLHSKKFIDTIKTYDSADPVEAISIFNDETSFWASKNPYLSLSGGFDSRTILSSLLKQDIYPTLVTLGEEDSSDVTVSRKIADKFNLEHRVVNLSTDELLESGERIAYITNGTKPAYHWHTYLYPRKAQVPKEETFFVGTLGEFARNYYFDRGITGILLETYGRTGQQLFWESKIRRHRTFRDGELSQLTPALKLEIQETGVRHRALKNTLLSKGGVLSGGSRYYLEQRVPNFYANGISMYNDTTQWRSPFHNIEWLKRIWNLSDNWKLGSNWHRLAIQRNCPELLAFSEEKGFYKNRMMTKAPPFYWLPIMQRMKYKSYDLSDGWYKEEKLRSFILDNRRLLEEFCNQSLVESILDEHLSGVSRVRAISFFLTMIYFKKALTNG